MSAPSRHGLRDMPWARGHATGRDMLRVMGGVLGVRVVPGCPSPAELAVVLALPWPGMEHRRTGSPLPWGLPPCPAS